MSSPFQKSFSEKSPLNTDPKKKKAYQDSIQKLHKPKYDAYVKKNKKGYYSDDADGGGELTYILPNSEPIISLKEYAYRMEIAKGGTVKKNGVPASKLAEMYK